jgi:SAM-dependent methyltransferase
VRELETNRKQWDERTMIHVGSSFYDVGGFKSGRCTLKPLELEELSPVGGKRLLHLQCHFGLDTLSWARRGAEVTGADFSREAIALARQLAEESHLDAKFVCSDIHELPRNLDGPFDVVFTSYGVLTWLPDLNDWAQVIAHFLDRGGAFYIAENHPVGSMLDEQNGELLVVDPYFDVGPIEVPAHGTYAEPEAVLSNATSYQWQHSLGDVINALTSAGLHIEFLHEFAFATWQRLPSMVKGDDGWWRLPERNDVPFLFSLLAHKA